MCKVCMGVLVRESSKGNTIYMNLYKNGCWNGKMRKNKISNLQVFENLIFKKRKENDYQLNWKQSI